MTSELTAIDSTPRARCLPRCVCGSQTSIYIDDELDRALAVKAAAEGVTKAELIRLTLGAAVASPIRTRPKAVGIVRDGKPPIARDIDAYLGSTGFGE
ncbi:MAG TPA: CopG family transcriptional regulator [Solirubrobacterales bacterium]|nr:CopG family transcriptional regulator [Solirubrobacterales bacterium]